MGQGQFSTADVDQPTIQAGQKDETYLSNLQAKNPAIANQVKALAEGRMAFPAGFALKSPYWQNMIGMVSTYDPSFDAVNYNARAATRRDFMSGDSSKRLQALSQAAVHLGQLSGLADQLHNSDFTPWNYLKNAVSPYFGNPAVTNFEAVKQPVAQELTRAWRGAGGAESDIQNRMATFNHNAAPEQLHGSIAQIADMMNAAAYTLHQKYKQGMGTDSIEIGQLQDRLHTLANAGQAQQGHIIQYQGKQYQYNGTGDTAEIKNYTPQ